MAKWNRREFLATGGAAAAWATGCASSSKQKPPNLVLILTDQQHIDTISAHGCRYAETPALDSLVRRGTSFRTSYCADPVCSPSRSTIFTGRMPSETDVAANGRPIRREIPNLGQWFSENSDYETVYSGKWHMPRTYQRKIAGFRVLPAGLNGRGMIGDPSVSQACDAFLRNRTSEKPFLLTVSFMQPHDICEWLRLNMDNPSALRYPEIAGELPPLPDNFDYEAIEPQLLRRLRQGNEPYRGQWSKEHWRYYLWCYYRHIELVDGEIGRVLRALEETGKLENTVLLFTSDHGEGMAHHQMVRKGSSYDEASRVPFLISWPGHFPENRLDETSLVSGADILPTLCDCAGIRPPEKMRGRSLRPLLEGRADNARGYVVAEIPIDAGRVVRTDRFKYVTYCGDTVDQLFDMKTDPGETKNLARDSAYAATVADHKRLLVEWEKRLDPAPNQPHADAWWRRA